MKGKKGAVLKTVLLSQSGFYVDSKRMKIKFPSISIFTENQHGHFFLSALHKHVYKTKFSVLEPIS